MQYWYLMGTDIVAQAVEEEEEEEGGVSEVSAKIRERRRTPVASPVPSNATGSSEEDDIVVDQAAKEDSTDGGTDADEQELIAKAKFLMSYARPGGAWTTQRLWCMSTTRTAVRPTSCIRSRSTMPSG